MTNGTPKHITTGTHLVLARRHEGTGVIHRRGGQIQYRRQGSANLRLASRPGEAGSPRADTTGASEQSAAGTKEKKEGHKKVQLVKTAGEHRDADLVVPQPRYKNVRSFNRPTYYCNVYRNINTSLCSPKNSLNLRVVSTTPQGTVYGTEKNKLWRNRATTSIVPHVKPNI